MAFSDSYKEPHFELLQRDGAIEMRKYSHYVIAKTSVTNGNGEIDNHMFRTLANYIFGGNSESRSIPMTAPVITREDDDSYDMIFFMLDVDKSDQLPAPNTDNISIETMNIGKAIAITFGMWATDWRVEYYKKKLDTYVEKNNIITTSNIIVAQYNSPWMIPPFRKNELIYTIE